MAVVWVQVGRGALISPDRSVPTRSPRQRRKSSQVRVKSLHAQPAGCCKQCIHDNRTCLYLYSVPARRTRSPGLMARSGATTSLLRLLRAQLVPMESPTTPLMYLTSKLLAGWYCLVLLRLCNVHYVFHRWDDNHRQRTSVMNAFDSSGVPEKPVRWMRLPMLLVC
jgi:hypothetical protein